MSDMIMWCSKCDEFWRESRYKHGSCPGTPIDLLAERERLRSALKEIWQWGTSVPPAMTQDEFNDHWFALADIKRVARDAYEEAERE